MTPEEFFQSITAYEAWLWIAATLAAFTLIALNWKRFFKWVLTIQQLITLTDDIAYIKSQLSNNGGSTTKDAAQAAARLSAENAQQLVVLRDDVEKAATKAAEAKAVANQTQDLLINQLSADKAPRTPKDQP